jgi:hypothetical protein
MQLAYHVYLWKVRTNLVGVFTDHSVKGFKGHGGEFAFLTSMLEEGDPSATTHHTGDTVFCTRFPPHLRVLILIYISDAPLTRDSVADIDAGGQP